MAMGNVPPGALGWASGFGLRGWLYDAQCECRDRTADVRMTNPKPEAQSPKPVPQGCSTSHAPRSDGPRQAWMRRSRGSAIMQALVEVPVPSST